MNEAEIILSRLNKLLTTREMRNLVKRAYRAEGKKVREMAVQSLHQRMPSPKGDQQDWDKGVRLRVYPRGGGFMVTVKGVKLKKKGLSMHRNRFGKEKPVLMWAEDGTKPRKTKTETKFFVRKRKGHLTGQMPKHGFIEAVEPKMYQSVERNIYFEVEKAAEKVAIKAGL